MCAGRLHRVRLDEWDVHAIGGRERALPDSLNRSRRLGQLAHRGHLCRIQIPVRTWLALLALALAVYAAIPLLPIVGSVATLLFFTTLLVLLINPLAMRLEQRGIKRRLTVAGVLLLVLVIALLVVLAIMPVLANSFGGLADQIQHLHP